MEDDELIGQVIASRYRIEEHLGSGAMGVVYRARHIKIGRDFAVKLLHPSLVANAKLRRRFEREAEVAATLHHRNVVGVMDVGETPEGLAYIVMEYADGDSLSAMIGQGPMPAARMIHFTRQLCDGLQHAHDVGLIHRDFKPDNVIVERDRSGVETLRIVDFGIALLRDEASSSSHRERLTTAGILLGTPHYMAPEHAVGDEIDHRIDLFALGVVCFEMLTGTMPFDGDGVDVARANMMFDTPPMGVRVPFLDVDPLLEMFTRKLMSRQRDKRPPTAKATRALLDLIERDRPAAARELGVQLPEKLLLPPLPPIVERPMLAVPVARVRNTPPTLEPGSSTATMIPQVAVPDERPDEQPDEQPDERRSKRSEQHDTIASITAFTRASPWRKRVVIGIAAAMLACLALVAVMSSRSHPTPTPEPTEVREPAKPPLSPTAVIVPERKQAIDPTIDPPIDPRIDRGISRPTTTTPPIVDHKPRTQITTKRAGGPPPIANPNPAITVEAPAEPTSASVAELYASVGRAMSHLQQTHGQDVTFDLWPRFRHIRINEAMMSKAQRVATTHTLTVLQRDIAERMRQAPSP